MGTIFTCENPQKILNKYTGEFQYVPCRKCNVCKSRRAAKWTHRLNDESKCHPYSILVTLTYNPQHLPVMSYSFSTGKFQDEFSTLSFDYDDIKPYLDSDSLKYLRINNNKLPYARVEDVQKFIKRLRERVANRKNVRKGLWNRSDEGLSSRYIRYFAVSEYGETLLRPHFHIELFTGSRWLAEHHKDVIRECWSDKSSDSDTKELGFTHSEIIRSSAASYVASYLNCIDSLPKIYQFHKFRPKSFSSKLPPIGSLVTSSKEIQALFNSGSVFRSIRTKDSGVLQVPLESDFCDRLYPRIQGFDRLPEHLRSAVYDRSVQFLVRERAERIALANEYSRERSDLGEYFSKLCLQDRSCKDHSTLNHLFSTMNRFCFQAKIFGISEKDYYNRIVDFWNRRNKELLKLQVEWKEIKSAEGLDSNFVYFAPDGVYRDSLKKSVLTNRLNEINCDCYDVDSLSSSVLIGNDCDSDWVTRRSLSKKVIIDGKNKHIKFEYLNKSDIDSLIKDYHRNRLFKKLY